MSFIGLNKNVFLILIVSHNLSVCIYTRMFVVCLCVCVWTEISLTFGIMLRMKIMNLSREPRVLIKTSSHFEHNHISAHMEISQNEGVNHDKLIKLSN